MALFSNQGSPFRCMSAASYACARAMERVGLDLAALKPRDKRQHREGLFIVTYVDTNTSLHHTAQGLGGDVSSTHAQVISYQCGHPEAMIETLQASRGCRNAMAEMWEHGRLAAQHFRLEGEADLPYSADKDFFYKLEGEDVETQRFYNLTGIIASQAFPFRSQRIQVALEALVHSKDAA